MLLKSENKLLTINGKLIVRKINTLSFEVSGEKFPTQYDGGNPYSFSLYFFSPQTVVFNFGDGVSQSYSTVMSGSRHQIVFNDLVGSYAQYVFTDGKSGKRIISLTFQDLTGLQSIGCVYCDISGRFPVDIGAAEKIESISLRQVKLTSFPLSLAKLRNLKIFGCQSATLDILPQIPEGLFENPLNAFTLVSAFNLSDHIASNFFKIDLLKDTLGYLHVDNSNLISFPQELLNCTKLTTIRADFNNFKTLPILLEGMTQLTWIVLGNSGTQLTESTRMLDFSNHHKIKTLTLRYNNVELSDLAVKWSGLYSLVTIGGAGFVNLTNSLARNNLFIDQFYILCTNGGSVIANGSPSPYPNRFRNVAWGSGTFSFTGTKVAPSGYIQGVSNGTPINQGQKVYVLQNQYNHTITHG